MEQLAIDFTTASKLNKEALSRQNRIIYHHLKSGKTINTVQARELYHVYNLHSRLSDIRKKVDEIIYDRMIKIGEMNCKEYSLIPFELRE